MFHTEFGQAWNIATSYASNTQTKDLFSRITQTKEIVVCMMPSVLNYKSL